jgi:hypothetical protein
MFMKPSMAVTEGVATYYNPLCLTRWLILAAASAIWFDMYRTMCFVVVLFSALYIGFSFSMHNTARLPEGTLIVCEELLVFVWFSIQLLLFYDQHGNGRISQKWVDFWISIQFGCFIMSNLIELVLVIFAFMDLEAKGRRSKKLKKELDSQELELDNQSANELDNKLEAYSTFKSRSATQTLRGGTRRGMEISQGGYNQRGTQNYQGTTADPRNGQNGMRPAPVGQNGQNVPSRPLPGQSHNGKSCLTL